MYITNYDFPAGLNDYDWKNMLDLDENPKYPTNFKRNTAMCFAIHNDFQNSSWGQGQQSNVIEERTTNYIKYKPPYMFIQNVIRDYLPLQAMTVDLQFGYIRVFNWYVIGQIYTKSPVSPDVGIAIIDKVKESLALFFSPANRSIGQKPTVMEVVNVIRTADSRIDYFDAGSLNNPVIKYTKCDPDYFNPISFCRFVDPGKAAKNIRISPDCLIK